LKIGWGKGAAKEVAIVVAVHAHVLVPPHLHYNRAGNVSRKKCAVLKNP
jgi:hypothetical protein